MNYFSKSFNYLFCSYFCYFLLHLFLKRFSQNNFRKNCNDFQTNNRLLFTIVAIILIIIIIITVIIIILNVVIIIIIFIIIIVVVVVIVVVFTTIRRICVWKFSLKNQVKEKRRVLEKLLPNIAATNSVSFARFFLSRCFVLWYRVMVIDDFSLFL